MRTFNDIVQGRDNNFDFIRAVAATSVIVAHAYPLAIGITATYSPLSSLVPQADLGRFAVSIFFALSGFLITKSVFQTPSIIEFALARFARIVPGYAVMILITALIVGPVVTSLKIQDYFQQSGTWRYISHNLIFIKMSSDLPGVFRGNPYGYGVNGSLWSLPYEIMFYIGVAILHYIGVLKNWRFFVFIILYSCLYFSFRNQPDISPPLPIFETSYPFVIGAMFYIFRQSVPLNGVILIALSFGTWILWTTPVRREILILTMIYGAFIVAWLPILPLRNFGRYGDFSYGIYIYGYVVEQTIVHAIKGIGPIALMAMAIAITVPIAVLSFHFVEKPALEKRHIIGSALARAWESLMGYNTWLRPGK